MHVDTAHWCGVREIEANPGLELRPVRNRELVMRLVESLFYSSRDLSKVIKASVARIVGHRRAGRPAARLVRMSVRTDAIKSRPCRHERQTVSSNLNTPRGQTSRQSRVTITSREKRVGTPPPPRPLPLARPPSRTTTSGCRLKCLVQYTYV